MSTQACCVAGLRDRAGDVLYSSLVHTLAERECMFRTGSPHLSVIVIVVGVV